MTTHLTLKSSNEKTGPIPVSTSSHKQCSSSCPFFGQGCYAESGPLAIHWKAVTEQGRGDTWGNFVAKIASLPKGQIWRHNQAGDLAGLNHKIDSKALEQLTQANNGKRGFTYTHKPVIGTDTTATANREAIKAANANGFTINLSANNLSHADTLAGLNIGPVVVVLPIDAKANTLTPMGRKVVVCPATQKENVSCATCGLCQKVNRSVIIGFPAHGSGKKKAQVATLK